MDLQRLLGLLQKALDALQRGPDASYNERATTMLYLGVLESWAIMLIRAEEGGESMAYLQRALQPMLPRLETMWMDALRDFALVSLPPEYATQVPEQGAFYSRGTRATVRGYYEEAFPQLLRAVAIRADLTAASAASTTFLLLGLCISALTTTQQPQLTVSLLASLRLVVSKTDALANEPALLNEVLAVLGHVLRTQGLTGARGRRRNVWGGRTWEQFTGLVDPFRQCREHIQCRSTGRYVCAAGYCGAPERECAPEMHGRRCGCRWSGVCCS